MKQAEMIIKNAAIYSVKMNDEEIHADAMAVADGKILCVGTEADVMKSADRNSLTVSDIEQAGISWYK